MEKHQTSKDAQKNVTQVERFKEAAKSIETDNSEEAFDRTLKKVAKPNPAPPEAKKR